MNGADVAIDPTTAGIHSIDITYAVEDALRQPPQKEDPALDPPRES